MPIFLFLLLGVGAVALVASKSTKAESKKETPPAYVPPQEMKPAEKIEELKAMANKVVVDLPTSSKDLERATVEIVGPGVSNPDKATPAFMTIFRANMAGAPILLSKPNALGVMKLLAPANAIAMESYAAPGSEYFIFLRPKEAAAVAKSAGVDAPPPDIELTTKIDEATGQSTTKELTSVEDVAALHAEMFKPTMSWSSLPDPEWTAEKEAYRQSQLATFWPDPSARQALAPHLLEIAKALEVQGFEKASNDFLSLAGALAVGFANEPLVAKMPSTTSKI